MESIKKWPRALLLPLIAAISLFAAVAVANAGELEAGETSDAGVVPDLVPGNPTCADLGYALGIKPQNIGGGDWDGDPETTWSGSSDGYDFGLSSGDAVHVDWTSDPGFTGAVVVKGGNGADSYVYEGSFAGLTHDEGLTAPLNASGEAAGISHVQFCYEEGPPVEPQGTISALKYYDANANGQQDPGESGIPNWKITISGLGDFLTDADGLVPPQNVDDGEYTVAEGTPVETNWFHTTPASVNRTVAGDDQTAEFGNVCIGGGGGGLTLGFWSNKNGAKLLGDDDLNMLTALNLRNANGSEFNPQTGDSLAKDVAAFQKWLLSANATNMANMLSAQLAAMELNVFNGNVDGTDLIYAPGTTSANGSGFATVNAVMAEANTSLGLNGNTVAAGPLRTYQEALKNALDKANNNLNFVQGSPCPFTFPVAP